MNEVEKYLENYIKTVFKHLEVKSDFTIVAEEDDSYKVIITGDNLNFLIGYRGTSLDGLQHLVSLSVYGEFGEWKNISVDINDYRDIRKSKLEEITKKYIDKVRFFKEDVDLPAMSSYDRKQVHEFVSGYTDVESSSVGEGSDRHVILKTTI